MIPLKLISIGLLIVQIVLSFYKRSWGIGMFLFIFITFPRLMPLFDFFDLGLLRCSIITAFLLTFRWTGKFDRRYIWNLIIFLVLLTPSFLFCDYSSGIYYFIFYYFVNVFVPGLIIYKFIRDTNDILIIYRTIFLTFLFITLYGLVELETNKNLLITSLKAYSDKVIIHEYDVSSKLTRFGFDRRVQSTSLHSIPYGGVLALFLIFIITPLFQQKGPLYVNSVIIFVRKYKWAVFILIALMIFNEFVSFSRSAWVACLGSLIFIFFSQRKVLMRRNKELKNLLVFFLIPVVGFSIFEAINYLQTHQVNGSTIEMREDQASYVYSLIKNNLIFGLGDNAVATFINNGVSGRALGFESIIFYFPTNYGIIGSIGFLMLYISTYVLISKPQKTTFSYFFYATLISHLIFGILTDELDTTKYFWLLFSFYYAAHLNDVKLKDLRLVAVEQA